MYDSHTRPPAGCAPRAPHVAYTVDATVTAPSRGDSRRSTPIRKCIIECGESEFARETLASRSSTHPPFAVSNARLRHSCGNRSYGMLEVFLTTHHNFQTWCGYREAAGGNNSVIGTDCKYAVSRSCAISLATSGESHSYRRLSMSRDAELLEFRENWRTTTNNQQTNKLTNYSETSIELEYRASPSQHSIHFNTANK